MLFSMSVTFGLPILVRFPSNTCFILRYPCLLLQNISSVYHHGLSRAQCANEGGGSHGWQIIVCGFSRKIILACYLMCQPEFQCRVPVQIPLPHGDSGVGICRSCVSMNSRPQFQITVNPVSRMQNGFIPFFCYELTQIREYNQGLPP